MNNTVLFVDDEVNILNAVKRLFINEALTVMTATSAAEAFELLKKYDISVIVSDYMMPDVRGIEFLNAARGISPDSVRILMTAHADMQVAIDAINMGEVYKFITKPWNNQQLKDTVLNAIVRHNLISSLRTNNETVLLSLAQTIELKDPYTRGHCDRVAENAVKLAAALDVPAEIQKHIRYGSWLHDCGKIGVPESILNFNGPLSEDQIEIIKNHSRWGAEVARLAGLSDIVVNVILYHHEKYDGTGYPEGLKGENIPFEARIVTVADWYDALSTDRPYRKRYSHEKALEIMNGFKNSSFDPYIIDKFIEITGNKNGD